MGMNRMSQVIEVTRTIENILQWLFSFRINIKFIKLEKKAFYYGE